MKATKLLLIAAAVAVCVNISQDLRASDFSVGDLSNLAVANSPRAREEYPQLSRVASDEGNSQLRDKTALAAIRKNLALANSPRAREEFPALAVGAEPETVASAKASLGRSEFDTVIANRALANSPRVREQYPELDRGYVIPSAAQSFEVAPVK